MRFYLALAFITTVSAKVCAPEGCLPGISNSQLLAGDGTTFLTPGVHRLALDPVPLVNQTILTTSDSVTVFAPSQPLTFPRLFYAGIPGADAWESLYLPPGWYASIGKYALWGAVPDRAALVAGDYDIDGFGNALCFPPCSHGTCVSTTDDGARCVCDSGWSGAACDDCTENHHGPTCQPCRDNCTRCDDGLGGSGYCRGSVGPEACNCAHGSCDPDGKCTCAAGWHTIPSESIQCNTCAPGFYLTTEGDCAACPAGCTACALSSTASEAECTSCAPNMNLSSAVPARCEALSPCAAREYYDLSTGSCLPCSEICESCTGPTFNECTTCALPRAMLRGRCEYMAATTGVCDSSLTSLDGTFVRSAEKGVCDSCPTSCKSCHLPEWNVAEPWSRIACTACHDGFVLQDNRCLSECSPGTFWSSTANGTACQPCDASCAACIGTATHCTSCPSGAAWNGTCVAACPEATLLVNGTCLACHPDCATCTSPAANSCLTCPPHRPVLATGRCVPFCAAGTVVDSDAGTCRPCAAHCTSCLPESCTACADGFVLAGGECSRATCDGPYAPDLGVCLSALVASTTERKSRAWAAGVGAGVGVTGALALAVALYIRRERRRTRAATAAFARQMDEQGVRARLARLFGYNAPRGARLRELVLRPRAARPREQDQTPRAKISVLHEQWMSPPPPYAPPTRPASPDFVDIPLEPLSLPPPPRASPGRIRIPDLNSTVRAGFADAVPLSPEAVRELGELWPHLGRRYSHSNV
ncbi:growth factor receptor domain-containing protein [Cutaneotrichosporon oleaginosum]|uniref:Growth factor receptor domain-containing protein n=1 Tax=Cutaneotrichosporon oleaginosum TaxID=879819 RepID=A0A0J0XHP0_9TREE|nr:growth factor receptor domain-containing protein [Cutaneotrichosporon oleaginosum]KLT40583.1 growth factor receptor domain-containing protein [Cutaneotrichosporon oleaginosum]TXT03909.1 hypothetical protein COLE_07606 [Cutaneotrichosporon oleaginosum]